MAHPNQQLYTLTIYIYDNIVIAPNHVNLANTLFSHWVFNEVPMCYG